MSANSDMTVRFRGLLEQALADGTLLKLTLGKPRPGAPEPTLRNVFGRPVSLQAGLRLSLVFVTKPGISPRISQWPRPGLL